ncbi:MAG: hypothetical protein II442_03965, partial [Oscillospiraceae bacterium]|nr:hypothetical protein [Oscillospiraceae bacterium]
MAEYDICILSAAGDAPTAEKLAASMRRYHPPKSAETAARDFHGRVVVDASGSALDDAGRALLDTSRFLVVLCS